MSSKRRAVGALILGLTILVGLWDSFAAATTFGLAMRGQQVAVNLAVGALMFVLAVWMFSISARIWSDIKPQRDEG